MQSSLEWVGSEEQFAELFWEAAECHCAQCGSTKTTVARDGEVLNVADPICCEVI